MRDICTSRKMDVPTDPRIDGWTDGKVMLLSRKKNFALTHTYHVESHVASFVKFRPVM